MALNIQTVKKYIQDNVEFGIASLLYKIFKALSLEKASELGGWLGRILGPYSEAARTARQNLLRVFPQKSSVEIESILCGVWDSAGRWIGEFAHIETFYRHDFIQIEGLEHLIAARDDHQPGLFFTGHIANLEIASIAIIKHGLSLAHVYRPFNNKKVDHLVQRDRALHHVHASSQSLPNLIPRGGSAGREVLKVLQAGGHLMMMVDQKMDNGISVPFLGRDAMTAPALAKLALKFQCPLIPVRVERLQGVRFKVTFFPPLSLQEALASSKDPVHHVMTRVNQYLEDWIRDRPDLWLLWLHRRWPTSS